MNMQSFCQRFDSDALENNVVEGFVLNCTHCEMALSSIKERKMKSLCHSNKRKILEFKSHLKVTSPKLKPYNLLFSEVTLENLEARPH